MNTIDILTLKLGSGSTSFYKVNRCFTKKTKGSIAAVMSLSMQLSRWRPSFTRPLQPLLQPYKLHPLLKPYSPLRRRYEFSTLATACGPVELELCVYIHSYVHACIHKHVHSYIHYIKSSTIYTHT